MMVGWCKAWQAGHCTSVNLSREVNGSQKCVVQGQLDFVTTEEGSFPFQNTFGYSRVATGPTGPVDSGLQIKAHGNFTPCRGPSNWKSTAMEVRCYLLGSRLFCPCPR